MSIALHLGITRISIRVLTLVFDHFRTGLVFVLRVNIILGFQNQASTRLRAQTFKIRLNNESRVGTPLCRNLVSNIYGLIVVVERETLEIILLYKNYTSSTFMMVP